MATPRIADILDSLQSFYGAVAPHAPTDPYEFLVWWHCGYPASKERCAKGWESLSREIGIAPKQLALATKAKLTKALKVGGMVPDLRAARLKEIAERVQREFAGDLLSALSQLSAAQVRKALKAFPGIGNPGADRISLFSRLSPLAAVPSACPHVPVRVLHGLEGDKYVAIYAAAQLRSVCWMHCPPPSMRESEATCSLIITATSFASAPSLSASVVPCNPSALLQMDPRNHNSDS